jgi:hypothetical protein
VYGGSDENPRLRRVVQQLMKHRFHHPLVAGLLVAACATTTWGYGQSTAATAGGAPTPAAAPRATGAAHAGIGHPRGATGVVVQVAEGGGFIAPQQTVGAVPSFTLYGNGLALIEAFVPQPLPGLARVPLVVRHLREGAIQAILARARHAGLLAPGPIDYGMVAISDMSTTRVMVHGHGPALTRRVYGLGVDSPSLTAAQRRARARLERFIESLPRVDSSERLYMPRAVAVWIAPATTTAGVSTQAPVVWPLPGDLATLGHAVPGSGRRCLLVRGRDARRLLDVVDTSANAATPWISKPSRNATFSLAFRPLLPNEHGCIGGAFGGS